MTEEKKRWTRQEKWIAMFAVILLAALIGLKAQQMSAYALDGARAAAWQKVCQALNAYPEGQPFPTSLAALPLEIPDEQREFLNDFEYSSNGVTCTVSTTMPQGRTTRLFPEM